MIKHSKKTVERLARNKYFVLSFLVSMIVSFFACDDNADEPAKLIEDENTYVLKSTTVKSDGLTGEGTEENPYSLVTAADFRYFIEAVQCSDIETHQKFFQMKHDIQVDEDFEWSAIGNVMSPFRGHFDGNGHSISGTLNHKHLQEKPDHLGTELNANDIKGELEIFYDFGYLFGLFGYCDAGGSISNLNMNANITVSPSIEEEKNNIKINIGSIAAYCDETTIENCTVNNKLLDKGNHIMYNNSNTYYAIGGICGFLNGEINNCTKQGSVETGTIQAGGVFVGGICGYTAGIRITDCTNSAQLKVTPPTCNLFSFGGICGAFDTTHEGVGESCSIVRCNNESDIICESCTLTGRNANVYTGGIAGEILNLIAMKEQFLMDCVNNGTVKSPDITNPNHEYSVYTGGIVGNLKGTDYYDNGFSVETCVNSGLVQGAFGVLAEYDYTGGIAGYADNANFTKCENHNDIQCGHSTLKGATLAVSGIAGRWIPDLCAMHSCSNDGVLIGVNPMPFFSGDLVGIIGYASDEDKETPCIFDCCQMINEEYSVGNHEINRVIFGKCTLSH